MNIIGITGRAGAGKDTAADVLVERFGFVKVALADPIKRICRDVFAFTDEQLWGASEKRNAPDERYRRADGSFLTPRYALQTLGTGWARACYENVWIDYAIKSATEFLEAGAAGVVIPDVRFPNELAAIRAAGGRIWRIERATYTSESFRDHVSETSLDGFEVDVTIENDGSLSQLLTAVGYIFRSTSSPSYERR
jgi:hypothetical protein